jgi:hypothetical protein
MFALFLFCFSSEDFLPIQCNINNASFGTSLLNYRNNPITKFDILDQTKCFNILHTPHYFDYVIISCSINALGPKTIFQIMWEPKYRKQKPKVIIQNLGYAYSSYFVEESKNILYLNVKMTPQKIEEVQNIGITGHPVIETVLLILSVMQFFGTIIFGI